LGLIDFNDGLGLVLMSILVPLIKEEFGLSKDQKTSLMTLYYLGMFVGAVGAGYLSDLRGRRILLLVSAGF
jgi:MFS transporter, putative metabolite:H+ symporter